MIAWALAAEASEIVAPITEVDHPSYADSAGTPLDWREVRSLAADTDALRRVRQRRLGRTVLRFTFAAVTAVEAWGAYELARDEQVLAYPLAAQAGLTGLCEVLMFTGIPSWRIEDRAILLSGANSKVRGR